VVSAQGDKRRTGAKDLAGGGLGAAVMFLVIGHVGGDVAAVHDPNVAPVQKRSAQVPVVVVQRVGDVLRGLPQRVRCPALIVGHGGRGVRHAEGNAQDGDIRLQTVEVERQGKIEEGPWRPSGGFCQSWVCHSFFLC